MSSDDTTWSDISELLFPSEIWSPIGDILGSELGLVTVFLTGCGIVYVALTYVEKTREIPGAWNPWVIFWIVVIVLIIFLVVAWSLSPLKLFGIEVFSSAPNTCVGIKGSLEGGLCYENCKDGYHGFGVRCYINTVDNGPGTIIGLEPCPENTDGQGDWTNMGLTCSRWKRQCHHWGVEGIATWWTGCVETVGRLDHGGVCPGPQDFDWSEEKYPEWKRANDKADPTVGPDGKMETAAQAAALNHKNCADIDEVKKRPHTEKIDGMCYKPCPKGLRHIPGMPYLCAKEGDLSYDRGGGIAPPAFRFFGKYTWPW
jgi:hypothetical protein